MHAIVLALLMVIGGEQSTQTAEPEAVTAKRGMVVSVSAPASEAGAAILAQRGNAVDSAIATALALAVTYPPAGNLGGGGFMMVLPRPGTCRCASSIGRRRRPQRRRPCSRWMSHISEQKSPECRVRCAD